MTIASKLQLTLDNKNAIKLALQNKGAAPTDVFSTYAGLIDELATSGIATPQIIAPINGATGVAQSPIITASRFSGLDADGFADVHVASVWTFASDAGFTNILHTSGRDTVNLESYDTFAAGVKFEGITVYARVTYEGQSGNTAIGSASMFETISIGPGTNIDGDIVIGENLGDWVLAAPATKRTTGIWGNDYDSNLNRDDIVDGVDPRTGTYNTDVLMGTNDSPAAEYCRSIGYDLPNINVIEMIYENRAQIDAGDTSGGNQTLEAICNGGSGTGTDSYYVTSSTAGRSNRNVRCVSFASGSSAELGRYMELRVIPVRRIPK